MSKLYSILNPALDAGGVTVNNPQPGLTTGAGGADGNTTALIVVSWQAATVLTASAGVVPHAELSLYLTFIVQHPGVFENKLFTWFRLLL